jgi:hypothetical protein
VNISRRMLLGSAAALIAVPLGRASIICTLEESRRAFRKGSTFGGKLTRHRVLVESSVGFAPENLSWLRRLGISVGEPRAVQGPAWVRFNWPVPAIIRDFGRVCPIAGGTVIAHLGDMPVAVRQGPVVVLGSPLGPHVYAGDPDARELLSAILGANHNQAYF